MKTNNTNATGLVQSLRVQVRPNHVQRLQAIENADFSGVIRKVREHFEELGKPVTEEYLLRGVAALKQYYAVALLDPANAHAVSAAVDPFWHAHILHTEDYAAFCDQVVGEYMHHQPLNRSDRPKLENVRTLYGYTLDVLETLFADVDPEFWGSDMSDAAMICFHKGNQELYPTVQPDRLFEPNVRGRASAFEPACA